jgi:dolichyl-phosphate beta-glucosyltransferase
MLSRKIKKYHFPLSVILPCYNEEKNIRRNIQYIHNYLTLRFSDFEIIVVNDGSTDKTAEELKRTRDKIRVIDLKPNHGKGMAVKTGILESKGEIVMFLDADLAIPIEELPEFLREIENESDIAIASRFIAQIKVLKPILWYRRLMEKVFRLLRMIIINNYDIQDTQCGFKVFTREAARKIFPLLTITGWSFDVEVIYLAKKMGLAIKELPVTLQNPPESHIRLVRDSWTMFWDLFRIRLNAWRGRYGNRE